MMRGFLFILSFQGLGELISKFGLPTIPGPVIGLVLMWLFLIWQGKVPESINQVAEAILPNLGLFFIPAAVGVVMYLPLLKAHAMAVVVALTLSVVTTIMITGLVLKILASNRPEDEHAQ